MVRPMPMKITTVSRKQLNSDATGVRGATAHMIPLTPMMYRYKAMEPEKVRAYLKACAEVAAARESKGLEEK
jgi:hypothetical protein